MPEIDHPLSRKFVEVNQPLFHTTSLSDFARYCRIGSVVSEVGKKLGTLGDPGDGFWNGEVRAPVADGPITLVFNCDVFRFMLEITACVSEGLKTSLIIKDPDSLYEGKLLRPEYFGTEIFTSNQKFPLQLLKYVLVDPVVVDGKELRDWVLEVCEMEHSGLFRPQKIVRRRCNRDASIVSQLLESVKSMRGKVTPSDIDQISMNDGPLSQWLTSLDEPNQKDLRRWLADFYGGTAAFIESGW